MTGGASEHDQLIARRTLELGVHASDLEHLHRIFFQDLHLCGCGSPGQAWALIHQLLTLLDAKPPGYIDAITALIGHEGACHMVLSMLDEARLTDHGGNIWGCWPTLKGRWALAVLNALAGHDIDDLFDELRLGVPHEGDQCADTCWAPRTAQKG